MKIDKTTPPLPASQIGEVASRTGKAGKDVAGNATASASSNVHLGNSTAQLRSLVDSVASTSTVDKEKVAAIKQAISEGRFKINNDVVAERLIDSVKELINASGNKVGSA